MGTLCKSLSGRGSCIPCDRASFQCGREQAGQGGERVYGNLQSESALQKIPPKACVFVVFCL